VSTIRIQFSKKYNGLQTVWFYRVPAEGSEWVEIKDLDQFINDNDLLSSFEHGGNWQEIETLSIDHWQTRYAIDTDNLNF
jgi:hypothetical protein